MKKQFSIIALVVAFFYSLTWMCSANATTYIVWNTKISIYAQSKKESTANLIESELGIYQGGNHPWCGKRAYIEMGDTELFAAALSASTSKQRVNFIYEDAAPSKVVQGHLTTPCKIISIFSNP